MIATSEPQEFIPFGRRYLSYHPGNVSLSSSSNEFPNPIHQEKCSFELKEKWYYELADECFDEELYWKDNTAVWSRTVGLHSEDQNVVKCFTVDNTIKEALWCHFCKPGKEDSLFCNSSGYKEYSNFTDRCICIVHDSFMDIINEKGEDFLFDLQFQPKKVWKTFYGIVVERLVTAQERERDKKDVPAVKLSLMHPLHECKPLIMRHGPKVSYCTNESLEIIFTSVKPSLCVVYDSSTGIHSVAEIRKALQEDFSFLPDQCSSSSTGCKLTSAYSSKPSQISVSSPGSCTSPYFSRNSSRIVSPSPSRSHSPLSHMATLSRSQSPTPVCQHFSSSSHQELLLNGSENFTCEPKPLPPDLCLDFIWSEPSRMGEFNVSASKVFLHEDCVQQKYLCYFVPNVNCLSLVRYEMTYNQEHCILGTVNSISAVDAVPLLDVNMVLVLKENFKLVLYSGLSKISIVHVPSVFGHVYTSFSKDFSNLSLHSTSDIAMSTPIARFKTNHLSTLSTLSPVICDESSQTIIESESVIGSLLGLKTSVRNVVVMQTNDGMYYKIKFPDVSTFPLVEQCVDALKMVLPRDVAIQLFTKWYSQRNTYGNNIGIFEAEWDTFVQMLLGMMGYDVDKLTLQRHVIHDRGDITPAVIKKPRSSENGTDEDWDYLLQSAYHREVWPNNYKSLGLHDLVIKQTHITRDQEGQVNDNSPLFSYIPAIFYTLHLLYEELKLSCILWDNLEMLAVLCYQLAFDLHKTSFCDHYWRDFPSLVKNPRKQSQISDDNFSKLQFPSYFSQCVPNIFSHLFQMLNKQEPKPFPYIPGISSRTITLVMTYGLLELKAYSLDSLRDKLLKRIVPQKPNEHAKHDKQILFKKHAKYAPHVAAVMYLNDSGIKYCDFESFPPGIILPVINAIVKCKENPPCDWNKEGYEMIGRKDLYFPLENYYSESADFNSKFSASKNDEEDDGMAMPDVGALGLRFGQDHRLHDVRRLLCSSKPVKIALTQRPDVSDHDFIEEQERHLYSLSIRTMALPVGRGMFTLGTTATIVTEPLQIPRLCLTGKAPPRNNTVDLSHIDVPPNMNTWPLFHNGVAAGLKIASGNDYLGSNWITFNKPKGSSEITAEHAGVLMALGLNGQLNKLAFLNMHDYLIHGHELTTVGLLLGIAAAKRGTMDVSVTRLLSIHIEALLPPSSTEVDVPANVQVAALLGVGFLYQQTGHRHMTEVLLHEIGRPPGPEMENSCNRESYSLAAGLALGLITLGAGPEMEKLNDLSIPDYLYHYIVGGQKKPFVGIHKDRCRTPSYQIREGDMVNTDVTCPGAILALGMMFFRSNNKSIAKWMEPPETQCLLDFIRPDFLLLQSIARGLILWDAVEPSSHWIDSYVPLSILPHVMQRPESGDTGIDYEGMNQAYCNLIAGACLVMGLKFAGSHCDQAFKTLLTYAKTFLSLTNKSIADLAGKSTIETCLNTIVLALAMVMSGSGNLEVLRLCRHLHSRIGTNSHVGYGSHMATHMAIGLLFLGGGRYSLGTSDLAIGAMLCAFFPKFPTHSNDNRYHLQAFRHLYVLAAEPRLIIPKEVTSDQFCYTHLKVVFRDTPWYKGQSYVVKAPCLLPEINLLEEVLVEDARYWSIAFRRGKNWDTLRSILCGEGILPVKQKAGTLSYMDDPHGYQSLLAQIITNESSLRWTIKPEAIVNFTSDQVILKILKYCLSKPISNDSNENSCEEKQMQQMLSSILFKCVTKEQLELFPLWVAFTQCLRSYYKNHKSLDLWQVKFLLQVYKSECNELNSDSCTNYEFALAIWSQWDKMLSGWEPEIQKQVVGYLNSDQDAVFESDYRLAAYLVMFDISLDVKHRLASKNIVEIFNSVDDLNIPTHTIVKLFQLLSLKN